MNPWAIPLLILATALIVIATKNKQDDALAALTGHRVGSSTLK